MTQENVDVLEFYFNKFDAIYVQPIIFVEFTLILIGVFIFRYSVLYKIEKNKLKRKSSVNTRNISLYIGGHCILELLAAFIISYCLIKLTNANPQSYIINMAASPAIGTLLAIYADNKILIPLENATGLGNVLKKYMKSSDEKNNTSKGNNVTININNGVPVDDLPSMSLPKTDKLGSKTSPSLLSEDLADSDDFNETVIKTINEIKNENAAQTAVITNMQTEQQEQKTKLDDTSKKLEIAISDLAILKQSEMINKKIELKKMIYECLNNGYATPEENDKITLYYESYTALNGNHEIESLYNNHFTKLPIHNRIPQLNEIKAGDTQAGPIGPAKRLYSYGQFDNEYIDVDVRDIRD